MFDFGIVGLYYDDPELVTFAGRFWRVLFRNGIVLEVYT